MVFSQYILSPLYSLAWHLIRLFRRDLPLVFYCPELIDYYSFVPVQKYLPELIIVSNNPQVQAFLRRRCIPFSRLPSFPKAVIMCRHATHKFPCGSIIKIGMRHGPYHFKRMTKAANYNRFDLYFFSSQADLKAAEDIGVRIGRAIGFPRLDPAFDGSISSTRLDKLKQDLFPGSNKPILLFSATWDASGMSALELWYQRLAELIDKYCLLYTLHPWVAQQYREVLNQTPQARYIQSCDLLPYLMISDLCIGDTSSLLAECVALDKPVITFRTPRAKRSLDEIEALLDLFSTRITNFEELLATIPELLANPAKNQSGRAQARALMFDSLDGKAGWRAAQHIQALLNPKS